MEEYDECDVNYIEARQHTNALVTSIGFYPIVALADTKTRSMVLQARASVNNLPPE